MWLFNIITNVSLSGKASFAPTENDKSAGKVIEVFGKLLRRNAVEEWLNTIQEVQNNLLVCTHLSYGSPGRATELETPKLLNTDFAHRKFYISQARVVIVTWYSKTRAFFVVYKVIPRFPDLATSKLFLTYLVVFRTLETAFVSALYGPEPMKTQLQYVFVERGAYYKAPRIRDVIRGAFHQHGIPIEFNHYRHYTAGMIPEVTEQAPRLHHNDLQEDAMAIAHLEAAHSTAIVEGNYARRQTDLPSVTSSILANYKLFSFEWHKCLSLAEKTSLVSGHVFPSTPSHTLSHHMPESLSNSITSAISKSIKQEFQTFGSLVSSNKRHQDANNQDPSAKRLRYHYVLPPHPLPIEENLETYLPALRTFFKDQSANFRSETQLHSTVAIAKASHNVLLIMPTGAGKTISILLPVYLEGPDSSTVIFVPLAALVQELVNKCQQLNLSVATWSSRRTLSEVYVISPDHSRRDIESFLRSLQNCGRLRRILFDEAHLLVLWSFFRPSFRRSPDALQSGPHYVQFVLCRATLPPIYRERLLQILNLPSVVLYDQPTVRLNLRYEVMDTSTTSCAQANGRLLTYEEIVSNELCQKLICVCSVLLQKDGGRILVFCLYRQQVEETRDFLVKAFKDNCDFHIPVRAYHGAMSSEHRDDCYAFWMHRTIA